MKSSFAIIGCGKVGRAFARHLSMAGYRPIGFASRSQGSARETAQIAGAPDQYFEKSWDAARKADIVFITPPDDAIKATCREIAEHSGFSENSTVFHCSGALSSAELAAAKESGARTGSLHPLQSFAADPTGNPFDGIIVAVEGDPGAVEKAREMATALGAKPINITTDGKILYHAAAVAASNYLVTLMDLAVKLMAGSGVSESEAFGILKPLITGTLKNIESVGVTQALTGPISRGDSGIVEKHIAAIRALPDPAAGEMARYYSLSGIETIKIARAKGTLSEEAAKRLVQILMDDYL